MYCPGLTGQYFTQKGHSVGTGPDLSPAEPSCIFALTIIKSAIQKSFFLKTRRRADMRICTEMPGIYNGNAARNASLQRIFASNIFRYIASYIQCKKGYI